MPIQVRETAESPWKAKEARLMCPHCAGAVYVSIPWNCLAEQRQRMISEAIAEHRSLCSKAPPEEGRVYSITYPRA